MQLMENRNTIRFRRNALASTLKGITPAETVLLGIVDLDETGAVYGWMLVER